MSLTKPSMTDVISDIKKQLAVMQGGKLYIAEGSYANEAAAKAIFTDLTAKATELSTNFVQVSDIAESPGNFASTIETLKSMNYTYEGKRSNVVTLNLQGVSADRNAYLEQDLPGGERTLILESQNGKDLLIFTGLTWVADHTTEFAGLSQAVIKSEFSGITQNKVFAITGLEPAA